MTSRITCITKPDAQDHHEAITAVGGTRASGVTFNISRTTCADDIRFKRDSYDVKVGNDQIDVTAYEKGGTWYIRTKPDKTQRDNLLNLPKCK
jgi:hypothetical protein